MSHIPLRLRAIGPSLCIAAALLMLGAPPAATTKIKMVFPGPVTTFSLPYLVAQKKGWMAGLVTEHVHVTRHATTLCVLFSGNADIGLVCTLNVLAYVRA